MKIIYKYFLVGLSILFLLSCLSCSDENIDRSFFLAKEQTQYSGLTIYLDSSLVVDNMPDITGNDLVAGLKLYSLEGMIPNINITKVKLYVLQEAELLWESPYTESVEENIPGNYVYIVFSNGPSDLRYKTVDVVLEFDFEGQQIRVMQKSVYISTVS